MLLKNMLKLVWVTAIAAGSMGGCKCQQGGDTGGESQIEGTPLAKENPQAPSPTVDFPARWHSENATLNAFIKHALQVCASGDYDGFRQLFGTAYNPTGRVDFERVWHNVSRVAVNGLYRGPADPPEYYLHAVLRWREPDRKGRIRRDAVLMLFREAGEWRLAPAPKEVVHKVLVASTRPAVGTQPGASTKPVVTTRPAGPRTKAGAAKN